MKEEIEKKSLTLEIVEFKYTLPIVIAIFLVVMTWVMVLYFRSRPVRRATIMTSLSVFGSTMLIFNLLLIVYRELRESVHIKRTMIMSIDERVTEEIQYIFREMLHNKDTLGQLHDEIMLGKIHEFGPNNRPTLTYYENNFMFIVMKIMQNFYRNYEFNTRDMDTRHNYNSWRQFMLKVMASPKSQQFYSLNKHLFNDILFNKFISIYVLPYVDHHIPISDMVDKKYMKEYNKHKNEWDDKQQQQNIQDIQNIQTQQDNNDMNSVDKLRPLDLNELYI